MVFEGLANFGAAITRNPTGLLMDTAGTFATLIGANVIINAVNTDYIATWVPASFQQWNQSIVDAAKQTILFEMMKFS